MPPAKSDSERPTGASKDLVLTLLGPDQAGLVESVASVVAGHGGSWEESQMARMAGQFAGIARVCVPVTEVDALGIGLTALSEHGLQILIQGAEARPKGDRETPSGRRLRLQLVGHDRPGILRDVTGALASVGASVEELSTRVYSAPMSGEALFEAQGMLLAPINLDFDALDEGLHAIADRLDLDLSLEEIAAGRRGTRSEGRL